MNVLYCQLSVIIDGQHKGIPVKAVDHQRLIRFKEPLDFHTWVGKVSRNVRIKIHTLYTFVHVSLEAECQTSDQEDPDSRAGYPVCPKFK